MEDAVHKLIYLYEVLFAMSAGATGGYIFEYFFPSSFLFVYIGAVNSFLGYLVWKFISITGDEVRRSHYIPERPAMFDHFIMPLLPTIVVVGLGMAVAIVGSIFIYLVFAFLTKRPIRL